MTKSELIENVAVTLAAHQAAQRALAEFEDSPENNVFADLDDANGTIEEKLLGLASEDCEGSHNCGRDFYEQEFIVDGQHYIGRLDVNYNRHDKTYYYVDGHDYSFKAKE